MIIYRYCFEYSLEVLCDARGDDLGCSSVECDIDVKDLVRMKAQFSNVQELLKHLYDKATYEKEFEKLLKSAGSLA